MEHIRKLEADGLLGKDEWRPETYEHGPVERLLAQILVQLQAANRPGERIAGISARTGYDALLAETRAAEERVIDAGYTLIPDELYERWCTGEASDDELASYLPESAAGGAFQALDELFDD